MFTDFEYADRRLSDFGYITCSIGDASGLSDIEIGCDITFSTIKNNHSSIHYEASTSYDNVYSTSFEIMKNPCNKNQDELYMSHEDVSVLTKWLNRREYRKFKPLSDKETVDIHYYGSFNIKEKTINDRIVGLLLDFKGNAPYGFGERIKNEFDWGYNTLSASGDIISVTDSANEPLVNFKLFGKGEQPTTEGNQLLNITDGEETNNGITIVRKNGIITVNGTPTTTDGYTKFVVGTINNYEQDNYTISVNEKVLGIGLAVTSASGNLNSTMSENASVKTLEDSINGGYIELNVSNANTYSNIILKYMFNSGIEAKAFEPYTGGEASPNMYYPQPLNFPGASGSIVVKLLGENTEQTFTALTPNGLKGIPLGTTIPDAIKNSEIHMSGVYWDEEEGKYYICDTKNENGKNVQRIYERTINDFYNDGTNNGITHFGIRFSDYRMMNLGGNDNAYVLCSHAKGLASWYGVKNICYITITEKGELVRLFVDESITVEEVNAKNISVAYILAEPITTDLTEEEIAEYEALTMNYPNTTIINDAGAYMEVEYIEAINNKFSIYADSDEIGLLYPNITITCKESGDLKITNITTGSYIFVANCLEGESIYINGEHKFIKSDKLDEHTTLYNDFNYGDFEILVDDNFSENEYEVSIPCSISIDYSPIRKVGVC